jgi:multidrug efflux pump subunit AcrA (membrane-fusion protein)
MNNFKKSIDGPMGNEFHYLNRLIWFLVFDLLVCSIGSHSIVAQEAEVRIDVKSVILKLAADVDVPARVQGEIESIEVVPNNRVKRGAVLAKINDQSQQLNLERSRLELEIAKSMAESNTKIKSAQETVGFSQIALERALSSRERIAESISDAEFSRLKLDAVQAKLQLETEQLAKSNAVLKMQLMESQVRQAQVDIDRHKIISPLDGVIAIVDRDVGEWVEPGDTVMRVIGMSKLRAEGFVDAALVSSEMNGAKVLFFKKEKNGRERQFVGTVKFVADEIDPVNQQKRIWAEIENADFKLQPGDRGRMVIAK